MLREGYFLFPLLLGCTEVNDLLRFRSAVESSHRPVVLFMYAPWCGHCTSFRPEFNTFAKQAEQIADVYAVDAHKNDDFARFFQLKGFPTLIVYSTDKRKQWRPYSGPRTWRALLEYTKKNVVPSAKNLKTDSDFDIEFIRKTRANRAVILFTEKTLIPTLFNLVGSHPEIIDKVPFFAVQKAYREQIPSLHQYFPGTYPHVIFIEKNQTSHFSRDPYDQPITYKGLVNYVLTGITMANDFENTAIQEFTKSTISERCVSSFCAILLNIPNNHLDISTALNQQFHPDGITFLKVAEKESLAAHYQKILGELRKPHLFIFREKNSVLKYHLTPVSSTSMSTVKESAITILEKLLDGSLRLTQTTAN